MKNYLNAGERNVIGWDLRHGFSIRKTAEKLKRAKSKVAYEVKKFGNPYFADKALEKWSVKVYHTFSYTALQRGRNENWNGILRRWYPKGTNFLKITQTDLTGVTSIINNIIRKKLDCKKWSGDIAYC